MKRQLPYMKDMLATEVTATTVAAALDGYHEFMGLIKHSAQEVAPTPMVDLIWHTHMLFPVRYGAECRAMAGSFVDHEDEVAVDRMVAAVDASLLLTE